MCILCKNIKTIGLENLNCSNCQAITSIPHIEGLQKLDCCDCPFITSIPHIQGLQHLECNNCPLITSIPHIQGLHTLICFDCPLITSIPQATFVWCWGCKWLNIGNPEFDPNIEKLKRLQKWFKSIILGKRLKNITLQLIPLYYHPLAKGGYLHKRDMLRFFENIHSSSNIC